MLESNINGYSSVCKRRVFLRGFLRGEGGRWGGWLVGVAWAIVLEGIRDASKRKYRWGFLQMGHFL